MDGGSNDIIADVFTKRAVDLLRVDAGSRRRVVALLNEMEKEIVQKLAVIDPTEPVRQSYREKRLATLLDQVRDTIKSAYRGVSAQLSGELKELADIEGQFVAQTINKSIGIELASANFTRSQITAIASSSLVQGAPVTEWWGRQAGDTLQRFTDAMRSGMSLGETNSQLIRRVRGGRENGEVVNGFMNISRRNADSLVRSATQAVSAKSRDATYQSNTDLIAAIVWTSTIDGRTSIQCQVRDGLRYTLDHEPIGHDVPWDAGPGALHWGCRSTSRPETKSFRELGIDIDDLPPSTRASMDGQIAADVNFKDWLAKRTKAQQDEALGVGRAELWRDGKITFRDLLDQNGRELTLQQLRDRI